MIPVSHIVMHFALCHAMLQVPEQTPIAVHMRLLDHTGRKHLDQDFTFLRYGTQSGSVEFDSLPGLYQLQISAPKYGCYGEDYLFFISGQNRSITEQLSDGAPPQKYPMLIDGVAPQSFFYLSPTYVILDKSAQCNKPVPDPLPVDITEEDDQDSFYLWMYPNPGLTAHEPVVVALQLQTPTGEDHYIRLKIPFPQPWEGFPSEIQFNVTDDEIDWLSGQPVDVLLCPRLFRTSAG
ncbi:MAG TPA: hypothetical protein VMD47_07340 [Candidatus Acidoferrales bacterium]|nr:hypothetical protein [Candidatus Acidoferrales bacterium]